MADKSKSENKERKELRERWGWKNEEKLIKFGKRMYHRWNRLEDEIEELMLPPLDDWMVDSDVDSDAYSTSKNRLKRSGTVNALTSPVLRTRVAWKMGTI